MITSKEIKLIKYVLDERCIPVKTDDLAKEYFNKYITQQEKVNELLNSYRQLAKLEDNGIFVVDDYIQDQENRDSAIDKIIDEIMKLESELK